MIKKIQDYDTLIYKLVILINSYQPRSVNIIQDHLYQPIKIHLDIPRSANINKNKQDQPEMPYVVFCLYLSYFPHVNFNGLLDHGLSL